MQVPVNDLYPMGEAVVFEIYTVVGGPFLFAMPPNVARDIGQLFIDTANNTPQIEVPKDWQGYVD